MIKIIDKFFNEEDLRFVQDFASRKAFYIPQYLENVTEKNKESFYGNRWHLNNNKDLKQLFIKQAELKFKFKINELHDGSGIDQRNLDHWKPHVDKAKLNILIMLKGPEAVDNGTVFFNGTLDNFVLDTIVGFRENRSVLFPSDMVHSPHLSNTPKLMRYTASLFITDYEEV